MEIPNRKEALRNLTAEGVSASVMFAITNAFLAVYASSLGATNIQIGLVVAAPAVLAMISYLPAAFLTEKWNNRRYLCTVASLISRIMWVFSGIIPLLLLWNIISTPIQAITLLAATVVVQGLFGSFVGPAWASIVGVVVPDNIRGSYFGSRNRMCAIASLVSGVAAGIILQVFSQNMLGFSIIFIAAGISGALSSYYFSKFPDIRFKPEKIIIVKEIKSVFANKAFRRFVLLFIIWQIGVSISSPFVNVYLINGLGAQYIWISFTLLASGLSTILVQKGWGRIADIFGHRSIMIISAFGASLVPLMWMLTPSYEFAVIIEFISGAAWAGFNIANFNYMLEITTGGKRAVYSAIFWTLITIPIVFAPIVGGFLIDTLIAMPFALNGFKGMFFISWAIRFASFILFAYLLVKVLPRDETSTRHVAKEVINTGFHALAHPFYLIRKRKQ